jgi:hypothetical protein
VVGVGVVVDVGVVVGVVGVGVFVGDGACGTQDWVQVAGGRLVSAGEGRITGLPQEPASIANPGVEVPL